MTTVVVMLKGVHKKPNKGAEMDNTVSLEWARLRRCCCCDWPRLKEKKSKKCSEENQKEKKKVTWMWKSENGKMKQSECFSMHKKWKKDSKIDRKKRLWWLCWLLIIYNNGGGDNESEDKRMTQTNTKLTHKSRNGRAWWCTAGEGKGGEAIVKLTMKGSKREKKAKQVRWYSFRITASVGRKMTNIIPGEEMKSKWRCE